MICVKEIQKFLDEKKINYVYQGNEIFEVETFSSLYFVKENSIVWIRNNNEKDLGELKHIRNLLIITDKEVKSDIFNYNYIYCNDARACFFEILKYFFKPVICDLEIGYNSIVNAKEVGTNIIVGCNTFIGQGVTIGNNVVIKNNVSIEGKVKIGNNTVIESGTVIGMTGYGYYKGDDGIYIRVPHFGGVVIGDNVEIGANVCIAQGTIDDTIIKDNVKIDNLCHIAHNVVIEENSLIVALTLVGGSAHIGKNSYIAPGVMIKNHIVCGENSVLGMGAVVLTNVDANSTVIGVPAKPIHDKEL